MHDFSSDRRQFLLNAGLAVGSISALGGLAFARRRAEAPPALLPSGRVRNFSDLSLTLTAAAGTANILPGNPTNVWRYSGALTEGHAYQCQPIAGSYLGPIIRTARGRRVRVRFQNNLPEESIVHWHGLDIPADQDGHPSYQVDAGGHYDYDFTVNNRAGMYWFHPHTHMKTASQVVKGLAGLFIVTDPEEQKADLPYGDYELPLVIQDRAFDENNQVSYTFGPLVGYLGNTVLINGQTNFSKSCKTRIYRLRILNGSNARTYKLAWSDGSPIVVIGTDGGLVESPISRPYVMLSPGERLDVWADFSAKSVGSSVTLRSLAWTPGGFGGGGSPPNGAVMDLAVFNITAPSTEYLSLPPCLCTLERLSIAQAANAASPRTFPITYYLNGGTPNWLLNGATYDLNTTVPNENVPRNTVELWQVTNTASQVMPHPIHFHGRQFQIYQRIGPTSGSALTNYNNVKDGYVDDGWKDTFFIMPGETVKFLVRTSDYPGLYLYHCHILEHEDMSMMRNFRVLP